MLKSALREFHKTRFRIQQSEGRRVEMGEAGLAAHQCGVCRSGADPFKRLLQGQFGPSSNNS
jgi:D-arabinose 1-dehydrogenase-like Zn-dependent alcohol dehydrogenase